MIDHDRSDLTFMTATELARLIRNKQVSAREVMEAHLAQIERVNPRVNAIVTLLPERVLEAADDADRMLARGQAVGPLHGLPIAHKDLIRCMPTTCPTRTPSWSNECALPGPSASAKPTRPSLARDRKPLTKYLARH